MIRTLNSLRFILILMIVISHSTLPISQDLINYLGEFPVAIFFVISGFVLSLSKGEKLQKEVLGNRNFFLSRIIKLYPLHILILAILILMDWRLGRILPWYQILSHSLLIQTWYPAHDFMAHLNAATWFISDLIFFYLIFKYLYAWIMRHSWLYLLVTISIYMAVYISISLCAQADYSAGYIYAHPLFRMIDFMIGILLYKVCRAEKGKKLIDKIIKPTSLWQVSLSDMGVVLLFIAMYFLSIHCNPNIRCAIIYWIPSAITVFYFTARDQGKGCFIRIFHNKLLLWLGSISFEIFLCHNLCFRIIQSIFLKRYGEGNPHQEFQFILSLAFIILTAWIAKKAIVLPIQHQLQKYL